MLVSGQRHAPAALTPRMTRYQLHRRLGGPRDQYGPVPENHALTGIRSPDHKARSEMLHRLSYLGPQSRLCTDNILTSITRTW